MRFDGDRDIQIARRTCIRSMFTFVRQSEPHAALDAGRDMHGNRALFIDPLASLAGRARFGHNLAGPFTLAARPADTEESLLEAKLSGSLAAGTGFDG